MSQKYLIRIAELERLLSEQAEALRQKDQQLSLVEETEAFLRSALTRAEEKIEEDEREIEHLRAQIEKLRRMLFGTRSEKLRREVELAEALLKQREQDSDRYSGREDDPQVPRQLRQSRHRRPLPAHLPREIHRLEPEESCCPECGGELDYLGEVSAEQLELVSSALKVIRTERVKKACTKCDCIVEAPAPSRPIERGIAGPGLLARVLTGKYCEHLPLYRQSEIFARQGVELSRALLSNWVDACCQLMTPVNDALYQMLPGYFRFVCQNGCVCGQSLGEVRVPHRGNVVEKVIEGAYEVVGVFDRIEEKRDAMQSLVLPPPARQALAQAALTYRYGDEHQPVTTADILTPRRREDYGKDLWSAYQTIQENMLKGGISGRSAKGKRIHTRAIHSIDTDIKLNRALWVMAETMLESLR